MLLIDVLHPEETESVPDTSTEADEAQQKKFAEAAENYRLRLLLITETGIVEVEE